MMICNMKPQHQMTKDDLLKENIELRKYIDKLEAELERQSDVFQTGSLTEIIEGHSEAAELENKQNRELANYEKRKVLYDMKSLYSGYRKRFGEKPATREVALNMKMILNQAS